MKFFDYTDPKIKYRIIIENELAFAFLTITPVVTGHTLICPKRHISVIDNLTIDELSALLELQKQLKNCMKKTFDAQGFNYARNEGIDAGQTVDHLHIHMLPRIPGDLGIYQYEPRQFLYRPGSRAETPEEELLTITHKIQENLNQ